ncbi:MAG: hypothetical protein ABEJ58_00045 [Halodesulfurarchaeum sp.]
MGVTVSLIEPLADDRRELECESVTVSEGLLEAKPVDGTETIVVPLGNVAGMEADSMETDLEQHPMQGGQYTQFVSRLS